VAGQGSMCLSAGKIVLLNGESIVLRYFVETSKRLRAECALEAFTKC
jgi:hypothetical protein